MANKNRQKKIMKADSRLFNSIMHDHDRLKQQNSSTKVNRIEGSLFHFNSKINKNANAVCTPILVLSSVQEERREAYEQAQLERLLCVCAAECITGVNGVVKMEVASWMPSTPPFAPRPLGFEAS